MPCQPVCRTNINDVNMDYSFYNGTVIVEGHEYFQKISNIQDPADIGSPPVQIYFCTNGQPNCSHRHDPIQVRKGQQINKSLSLAIVNQINDPLQEATILSHSHLTYLCKNHIQSMDGSCSNVDFVVSSNNDTEELILSLSDGPCKDTQESKARVTIEFSYPQCLVGYANNTMFLCMRPHFITVFISWLNTCFFVGMDAYSKTQGTRGVLQYC